MAVQHDHVEAPQDMIDVHSGVVQENCFLKRNDAEKSVIEPEFVLECAGCCWKYLVHARHYRIVDDSLRMVKFDDQANISCFVTGKTGAHGVVKTRPDLNISQAEGLGPRPFAKSITYQLYGTAPLALATDEPMTARIESIGVKVLTANHMKGSYLNYADAAMLELFREGEELGSLQGRCCWPAVQKHSKPEATDFEAKMSAVDLNG